MIFKFGDKVRRKAEFIHESVLWPYGDRVATVSTVFGAEVRFVELNNVYAVSKFELASPNPVKKQKTKFAKFMAANAL